MVYVCIASGMSLSLAVDSDRYFADVFPKQRVARSCSCLVLFPCAVGREVGVAISTVCESPRSWVRLALTVMNFSPRLRRHSVLWGSALCVPKNRLDIEGIRVQDPPWRVSGPLGKCCDDMGCLCLACLFGRHQGAEAEAGEDLAPLPPRSIDVRVWVTRPHLALLEFPMSPNTSALLLEGGKGLYYRWQLLMIAQVRRKGLSALGGMVGGGVKKRPPSFVGILTT